MKLYTPVHMMIRSVGESGSGENMFHIEDKVSSCILALAKWLGTHEMKQRFDVCFGRSKDECENRLLLVGRSQSSKQATVAASREEMDRILDEMLAETGEKI